MPDAARSVPPPPFEEVWNFLAQRLPVEDLTTLALRSGPPADDDGLVPEEAFDEACRGLYRRRQRHLLVTGLPGVGKTSFVRELARRAALGRLPFLAGARFLRVDCRHVGPEDSRGCLETVLSACAAIPRVVLCLDAFDALLRRAQGGTNKPLVCAAADRPGLQLVGILDRWAWHDLVAGDARLLELFTCIEIPEPDSERTLAIARRDAQRLSAEFRLRIDESVVRRTVSLASDFVFSPAHPAKSARLLEQACEDADYDRSQFGLPRETLAAEDVIRVVSARTGIPAETLAGEDRTVDFESALADAVVGQDAAVRAVAARLRLIKAGLNDPGKPAGVFLFAGMTGVGKTELAKRVAALYSSSGLLRTYAMGNYTEPHSVSGIIGVPPGYVGHEQGGRLVAELDADPHAVFLLDEAEKAHPDVWKPFLNLFDEGWIDDQRGLRAHADRALFLLTSNAGDQTISQMTKAGKPDAEIAERVRTVLSKHRHERSGQPVFTPQFLARIQEIVVFRALDEEALVGIARRQAARLQALWLQRRERRLVLPDEALAAIGRLAHAANQRSAGREGGRIVRKLLSAFGEPHLAGGGRLGIVLGIGTVSGGGRWGGGVGSGSGSGGRRSRLGGGAGARCGRSVRGAA